MSDFPYPGLRPFQHDETDIFFGRDELSTQLIDKLGDTHFLAVVGTSGCGKSSLVHTGLVAGLERGLLANAGIHWRIAEFRPGNRPFVHLSEALLANTALRKEYTARFIDDTNAQKILEAELRRGPLSLHEILLNSPLPPDTNLLLVVDQFEELFRHYQQGEANEAAACVNLLLKSSKPSSFTKEKKNSHRIYVVITMRSDFISDCALFFGLPEAINQGLFLTPRLTREQLCDAIEGPARMFGGQIEPALTNHLLNEMSHDPDQLPVLQHALMRMWDQARPRGLAKIHRENLGTMAHRPPPGRILSLDHYREIGELKKALSQHVDTAYTKLTAESQKIAEVLFRRLCERDKVHRDTRSPTKLDEVAELAGLPSWQQIVPVADEFRQAGRHFLTPIHGIELKADSVIDISHESLIKHWERLKTWANEEAESAKIYRRLEESACLWEGKYPDYLWSGVELEGTHGWRENKQHTALWAKRYTKEEGKYFELAMRFLEESKEEQKRKEQKEEAALSRELKLKQARRQTLGAIIASITILGFAIWAWVERDHARQQEQKAEQAQLDAQLNNVAWLGRFDDYKTAKGVLKKISESDKGIPASRRPAYNFLKWFDKFMGSGSEYVYEGAGAPLFTVAASSDGKLLAAAGEKGALVLFDVNNGNLLRQLQAHSRSVKTVVFHPQDQWIASAGYDRQIIVWSLSTGKQLHNWKASEPVMALAVSPDGKYLASGGKDNHITLREVATGQSQIFEDHKKRISDLAFSPDGEFLASTSYDDTARLWRVKTGQILHTLTGHTDNVQRVAFSPDGKLLATSSKDTTVRLWDLDTGKSKHLLLGHRKTVFGVCFVAGGRYLVSASDDRTLRIWDTRYGVTMRVLQAHNAGVIGIAVHEEKIFSASNDGTVMRWNTALPYWQSVDLPDKPASTAIAPDGNSVAVGFTDGALRLYALPEPNLLWEERTAHTDKIKRLAFSSTGILLASASSDRNAKLWQVEDGKLLQTISGHTNEVNAIAFSPDGHVVATAGFDGQIGLFTAGTEQIRFYPAHEGEVKAVSFNASGTQLLSTGNYAAYLWTLNNDSLTLLRKYPLASSDTLKWSVLGPYGQQIASVGREQLVYYSTTDKSTRYKLSGHESTIYRAIFSPDGRQAATVSADATLRFWDLHNNGSELFTLRLPANSGRPVPLEDFDFRCTPQGTCRIAIPLTRGKLMLYELKDIYNNTK